MSVTKRVAIIGAGIAGLSCASALKNAGFKVTLFEKSKGVSGRLSTRVTEQMQCDHGAQYFTARDPLFNSEVQRWIKQGLAQQWDARLAVFEDYHFIKKDNNTVRYVGYPQNNAPSKWLAESLNIITETTVSDIQQSAGKWMVSSIEHGLHSEAFDYVVTAIPAPQAANLFKHSAPHLHEFSRSVIMRPCFALMLKFDYDIPCLFDGLFIQSGILSWVARDSIKPGRKNIHNTKSDTWILHASAEWSEAHVDDSKDAVAEEMLTAFKQILMLDESVKLSTYAFKAPSMQTLHRWLYADCANYLSDVYHYDHNSKIGICGDWMNGGKVQGAWLSGLHLANSIIASNP